MFFFFSLCREAMENGEGVDNGVSERERVWLMVLSGLVR